MSRMKKRLFYVPVVMLLMSAALLMTKSRLNWTSHWKPRSSSNDDNFIAPWTTTTGSHGTNLRGKMFTLASYAGGVSLFAPYSLSTTHYPWSFTSTYSTRTTGRPYSTTGRPYSTTGRPYSTTGRPYSTTSRPYSTTGKPYSTTGKPYSTKRPTTTYPPWTTRPPRTRGVSVCLRYLIGDQSVNTLFTLSPSSTPLRLGLDYRNQYRLSNSYDYMSLSAYIPLWSNIVPDIWTRICLTLDSRWNVVQLFSSSNMTIRKMLANRYVWSGEPVIDFQGFDGQVTDVQVWDYPLRYKEVFNYMTKGVYAPYQGNVLTWSSISYSLRGDTLLEDVYERQVNEPDNSRRGEDMDQNE